MEAFKSCITCAEPIPEAALKCNKCGGYQDWRRHLDIGQGALALLIALISVSTLAADTGIRAMNAALFDPLEPNVTAKVLRLDLNEVKILVANNGNSRVFLYEGALCRVPIVKPGVTLMASDEFRVRYPLRSEVDRVYTVSFHAQTEGSRFIEAGSGIVMAAPRASIIREQGLPLQKEAKEIKGYCFVNWIGQNSKEDGTFLEVSALDSMSIGEAIADLPEDAVIDGGSQAAN